MLWLVFTGLMALWIVAVIGDIGGGLVHIVLVAALAVAAYQIVTGRAHESGGVRPHRTGERGTR